MKLVGFSLLVLIISGPLISAADKPLFQAGAAAVDITPDEFPMNMPGGFSANLAEKAHDPFHSRALVMSDGKTTVAMVVVDNLGAGPEVLGEAKAIAAEKTGIPVAHMLISSTHTHSGPSLNTRSEMAARYYQKFVHGVAESIVQAHAALEPAAMGAGAAPLAEEVFNRRWYVKEGTMPKNPFGRFDRVKTNPGTNPAVIDRPAGPTDPDISILSVQDLKRRSLALYANYSLHYVGGAPKGQMSADYFGEFARLMPSRLPSTDKTVAMMSNGTSGDINNIPFGVTRPPREPFEQIRIVAQKAADTAWRAYKDIPKHETEVRLGMLQREVTLKYRRPSPQEVAEARAVLAIKDKEAVEKLPRLAQNYARNTLAAFERPAEETLTVELQALRIGDLAVCAIPFEVFVEIGLDLKKRSPFPRTMVVGLGNGKHGYLPTLEQHSLGGYETWLGTNRVQEDTSVILTDHLLKMLTELKAAD